MHDANFEMFGARKNPPADFYQRRAFGEEQVADKLKQRALWQGLSHLQWLGRGF